MHLKITIQVCKQVHVQATEKAFSAEHRIESHIDKDLLISKIKRSAIALSSIV
jgi:hypothetical protein